MKVSLQPGETGHSISFITIHGFTELLIHLRYSGFSQASSPSSNQRNMSIDSVSGPAAATLLSAAYAQSWSTRQHEVSSEVVCWALLPLLFVIGKRTGICSGPKREPVLDGGEAKSASEISLWIFALCVVVHSLCRAEQNTDWLLVFL